MEALFVIAKQKTKKNHHQQQNKQKLGNPKLLSIGS